MLTVAVLMSGLLIGVASQPASADTLWPAAAVSTWAGSGSTTVTDGVGTAAGFTYPTSEVVVGGYLYIADGTYIRRADLATRQVVTIAGSSYSGCSDSPNPFNATLAATALASDGSYLYFLNGCGYGDTYLRRMSLSSGAISTMFYRVSGPSAPTGVAVVSGSLYIVTSGDVQRVDTSTFATTTVASVPAVSGESYVTLSGLAGDSSVLWTVDTVLHRLVKVDPASGSSSDVSRANISAPVVSVGQSIFASVYAASAVRQISKTDGSYTTVAGTSAAGFVDGVGPNAWFGGVSGLASDGQAVYVGDTYAHRIRQLVSSAPPSAVQPSRYADTLTMHGIRRVRIAGGAGGVVDGRGAAAGFGGPGTVHVAGNVAYVGDSARIRKVDLLTGQTTTVAGTGTSGCADAVNPLAAQISPGAMASDGSFLYFTNNCGYGDTYLRRMSLSTGAISTLFYRVYDAEMNGLTIGPGGQLYMLYRETLQRIDTANATAATVASLPTPSGVTGWVTATALASDGQYLWTSARYTCQGPIDRYDCGGGIYRTDPTSGASVLLYSVNNANADVPSSSLVSAGNYLYGYYAGSNGTGIGRWDKNTGVLTSLVSYQCTSYPCTQPSMSAIDVHAHGLVAVDGTDRILYRLLDAPPPTDACGPCLPREERNGSEADTQCSCGDPISTATGSLYESVTDLAVPGRGIRLAYSRSYDTQGAATNGRLGYGWVDSYGMRLAVDSTSTGPLATAGVLALQQENGSLLRFVRNADGSYSAATRVHATLVRNADGTFTFTRNAQGSASFDATGRLSAMRDLNGYTTTVGYDANGRLSTVTEPAGRSLTFSYDASNRVTSVTDTAGRTMAYGYSAAGDLVTVTDPAGRVTGYGYDGAHRLITLTDPRGHTTTTVYDADGKAIRQTDRNNKTTTFDYTIPTDVGSWVVTITDPRGVVTRHVYDHANLVSRTDAVGTANEATWTYTYDPVSNERTSTRDPLGHTWSWTYDASGNRLTATDPLQHTSSWTYNAFNEVLTATDANNVTTTSSYDAAGNLLSTSRPLVGSSPAVSATTTYTYGDPAHPGDVTAITDARGKVWQRGYDSYGQLTSSIDPLGNKTTTSYVCAPAGPGCRSTIGWSYATVSPRGNATGATASQYTTSITRNDDGQVLTVTDPLTKTTSFGYDNDGNQTSVTDANTHTTTTDFDNENRPTLVTRADTTTLGTGYDEIGNVTSQTDPAHKVPTTPSTSSPASRRSKTRSTARPTTATTSPDGSPR